MMLACLSTRPCDHVHSIHLISCQTPILWCPCQSGRLYVTIVGQANVLLRASARRFPVHRFHFRRFLGRTKFAVPSLISQGFCVFQPLAAFCAHYSSDGRDRGIRKCFFITRGKKIWGDAAETDGQTDGQTERQNGFG